MKTKSLSLFLALVMILACFAGTFTFASAEVAEDPDGAWEVNGKTYSTLQNALAARGNATTIYLIKDYNQTGGQVDINIDGSLTIEGKGATKPTYGTTGATARLLRIGTSSTTGNITLKNIKMDDTANPKGSIVQINNGTLTLDGVEMKCKNVSSGAIVAVDGAITVNVINGSSITMMGDTPKTGAPGCGAFYMRGPNIILNVIGSTIDASGYCAAIYSNSVNRRVILNNSTIKATSGIDYAVFTNGANILYKAGTTTITGGKAVADVTPKIPTVPTATTEEAADAAAAAEEGFIVRYNESALAAMADADGDGIYFDGYGVKILPGTNYLVANYQVTAVESLYNCVIDGQNKYKITQATAQNVYRVFNVQAAGANVTFRNLTLEGIYDGLVSTKQPDCTVTFNNVTANYDGAYSLAILLSEKANTTFNIINSTFTQQSPIGTNFVYSGGGDNLKVNIVNSTITKIQNKNTATGSNVNAGLIQNSGKTYSLVIKNSTIDYTQSYAAWENTETSESGTVYERIIYNDKNASACTLILENATLKKGTGGGAPICWYAGSTIHMYGNNKITGGDRMLEMGAGGENTLYYLGANKAVPTIDTLEGASVRTVAGTSGLRFESVIPADVVEGLKNGKSIVSYSYGTVIMKASDLNGTTVDKAIAAGKTHVDVEAKNGIINNDDGSVTLRAALVDIQDKNYGVEFVGVAYIEITVNITAHNADPDHVKGEAATTQVIRIYSDYVEEDNARSITEVAKAALDDVKAESSDEIVNGYRYNNELEVGETYYDNGEAKTVAAGEKIYSAYNKDQREILKSYIQ